MERLYSTSQIYLLLLVLAHIRLLAWPFDPPLLGLNIGNSTLVDDYRLPVMESFEGVASGHSQFDQGHDTTPYASTPSADTWTFATVPLFYTTILIVPVLILLLVHVLRSPAPLRERQQKRETALQSKPVPASLLSMAAQHSKLDAISGESMAGAKDPSSSGSAMSKLSMPVPVFLTQQGDPYNVAVLLSDGTVFPSHEHFFRAYMANCEVALNPNYESDADE